MNATTKTATVTVATAKTANGYLPAGTYRVEMPSDYDPALVTGEDIVEDGAITIVDDAGVGAPLTAEVLHDTWTVGDASGNRWWPSDEAAEEIAASDDPAAAAMVMAYEQPMRGEWCR